MSGSSRTGSNNHRLLLIAMDEARALGADVTVLDLRDLALPIYDPDLSAEVLPQGVRAMRQMLAAHDGLLIASPEYHGSLPPLLKNALDWSASKVFGTEALTPFKDKPAAMMDVAQGPSRRAECHAYLRSVLEKMGFLVLRSKPAVSPSIFSGDGDSDPELSLIVRQQVLQLLDAVRARSR